MSKKNIAGKIAKIAAYVLCAALAVLVIFIMISNAQKKITFLFGRAALWVMTPSMEPGIPEQSYILVKKADAKDVKLNDVITFYSSDPALNGALNTHRVVEIIGDNEEFVTRGDNNSAVDAYRVPAENVVAVYVSNMPVYTVFGRFMTRPAGIITMIVVIFALMIAVYVPDIVKSEKAKKAAEDAMTEEEMRKRVEAEVERLKREGENKSDKDG